MHNFLTCNHNTNSMSLKLSIHVDITKNSLKKVHQKNFSSAKKKIREKKKINKLAKLAHGNFSVYLQPGNKLRTKRWNSNQHNHTNVAVKRVIKITATFSN